MHHVTDLLEALGVAGLQVFWMPLAAWTLVGLSLYGLLRLWKGAHPLVQYHAHTGLLLALPLGLLLAAAADLFMPLTDPPVVLPAAPDGWTVWLSEDLSSGAVAARAWTLYHLLGVATAAALLLALWQLARLLLHAAALARFHRSLDGRPHRRALQATERLGRQLGVRRRVRTILADRPVVPMTFGWRRPVIVLPAALAEDPVRLEMALAHELVHVRRRDYLLHWIEQVVGALFVVHPLVTLLRRTTARYREEACDAAVLASGTFSHRAYAALLYSFLTPTQPSLSSSLGMAETTRHLRQRLLAMKSFARINRFTHPKLSLLLAGLILLTAATVIVACTDLVGVDKAASVAEEAVPAAPGELSDKEVFVIVEEMPELVGGLASIQQNLRYPAIAKEAGLEGRVIVQFIVDEQGNVTDAEVVRGVGAGLDEEALRVVREAQFKPGRQRGVPVKVKMSIPITFRLSENTPSGEQVGVLNRSQTLVQFAELERTEDRISGRILSREGEPIPGANLVLQGSERGAATDADGRFVLTDIPLGQSVVLKITHPTFPGKELELHFANKIFGA